MYKIEKGRPFYTTLRYLGLMHEVPISYGKSHKQWLIRFSLLKIIIFFIGTVGPILHLVMSIKEGHWAGVSEDLSALFGLIPSQMLGCLFAFRYNKWMALFNDLINVEQYGTPPDFKGVVRRLDFLSKIFIAYFVSGSVIYAIANKYEMGNTCKERNREENLQEICGTYIPIWLPLDTVDGVTENAIFIVQWIFCAYFTCSVAASVTIIIYECTKIIGAHIRLLNKYFLTVFDVDDTREISNRLRFCVEYHNHILALASRLNEMVKYTAGYMSFSAITLGFVAVQIFKGDPISSLLYFLGFTTSLFILCHAGQTIKDQTMSITNAVYDSKWYKVDSKTMRDIQFILLRSQKPIYYEAMPMAMFDYALFLVMIKTSYSFVTVLSEIL